MVNDASPKMPRQKNDNLPLMPEKHVVDIVKAYSSALRMMWLVLHIFLRLPATNRENHAQ